MHQPDGPVLLFATDAAHEYLLGQGMHARDGDGATSDAVFVAHADAVDFARARACARASCSAARGS